MMDAKPLAEAIAATDEQGRFRARPLLTTRDLSALVKGWLGRRCHPPKSVTAWSPPDSSLTAATTDSRRSLCVTPRSRAGSFGGWHSR